MVDPTNLPDVDNYIRYNIPAQRGFYDFLVRQGRFTPDNTGWLHYQHQIQNTFARQALVVLHGEQYVRAHPAPAAAPAPGAPVPAAPQPHPLSPRMRLGGLAGIVLALTVGTCATRTTEDDDGTTQFNKGLFHAGLVAASVAGGLYLALGRPRRRP